MTFSFKIWLKFQAHKYIKQKIEEACVAWLFYTASIVFFGHKQEEIVKVLQFS